jgi:hypothetical protein
MTITGMLVAASTPAATCMNPVAFCPLRAVAVPTVTSAAQAEAANIMRKVMIFIAGQL